MELNWRLYGSVGYYILMRVVNMDMLVVGIMVTTHYLRILLCARQTRSNYNLAGNASLVLWVGPEDMSS